MRVLFVSNGHGEEAIAARIAGELRAQCSVDCDHLALVGEFGHPSSMIDVGPRRKMPSGGLIAMGQIGNVLRDLHGGLLTHTWKQVAFLRGVRGRYTATVAVGDAFALLMARLARAPKTIFVGTAKSVYLAPYGPLEERLLRGSDAVFVRDAATAARLRERGVPAQAPGNVIVDLFGAAGERAPAYGERLALFPGSRESAYTNAARLCDVVRAVAGRRPSLGATLSLAPGLRVERFETALCAGGWSVVAGAQPGVPFALYDGSRRSIDAWSGDPGGMLEGALLVLGQAGTANEAAAARGIPVIAFERGDAREEGWYRMRQSRLLGEALQIVAYGPRAAQTVEHVLDDPELRARMGAVGRERMGPPGGAKAIAANIAAMVRC